MSRKSVDNPLKILYSKRAGRSKKLDDDLDETDTEVAFECLSRKDLREVSGSVIERLRQIVRTPR